MSMPLVEGGFGNCYLLCTSDGPKNASDNVEDDGPQKGLCLRLPNESELMPHSEADQYLEVGLVIGEEPGKYRPTGLSRNKGRQEEQTARGALDRSQNATRAFIRITSTSNHRQSCSLVVDSEMDTCMLSR